MLDVTWIHLDVVQKEQLLPRNYRVRQEKFIMGCWNMLICVTFGMNALYSFLFA